MSRFYSIPGVKPIRKRRLTRTQKDLRSNERLRDLYGKEAADEHRACAFDGAQEKAEREREARKKEFFEKVRQP